MLNNVEVSSEFAVLLKKSLLEEAERLYKNPDSLDMIKTCLGELDQVSKTFKNDLLMVIVFAWSSQLSLGLFRRSFFETYSSNCIHIRLHKISESEL